LPASTIDEERAAPLKKLIVFDLDGTLAESKSALSDEMSTLLGELLSVMQVAVISGGAWEQFESQLLAQLPKDARLANLSLLPTCGTRFYSFDGKWSQLYAEDFTESERTLIVSSLNAAMTMSGVSAPKVWGEVIEDRGSQITMSALGQRAPLDEKEKWDPTFAKRQKILAVLEPLLLDFSIRLGGTTSIDITKRGIDKAYGILKLRDQLQITLPEMIFVGDAIFEGGNDYPVQQVGVDSILVSGPSETARIAQTVISCVGDGAFAVVAPQTET
jgi:phosphomannomutase